MEHTLDSCRVGSRICAEQEETSTLRPRVNQRGPTEWTDKKHSLFLDSMEATFVNQLNKSFNLFGRHSNKICQPGAKSSKHKRGNSRASGQFMVLRNGRWSKIDFKDEETEICKKESLLGNQWIKHYRCSEGQTVVKIPTDPRLKVPLATCVKQNPANNFRFWRQDSLGSNAEVTGQNFNEEGLEDQGSGAHEIKRTRT